MQWRIQYILKVRYAKMVTNLLKEYTVIIKTRNKDTVQAIMRKNKIK